MGRSITVVALACLALVAGLSGVELVRDGQRIEAIVYALLIPLGTLFEWRRERQRGNPESADRLAFAVALTLTAALL